MQDSGTYLQLLSLRQTFALEGCRAADTFVGFTLPLAYTIPPAVRGSWVCAPVVILKLFITCCIRSSIPKLAMTLLLMCLCCSLSLRQTNNCHCSFCNPSAFHPNCKGRNLTCATSFCWHNLASSGSADVIMAHLSGQFSRAGETQ